MPRPGAAWDPERCRRSSACLARWRSGRTRCSPAPLTQTVPASATPHATPSSPPQPASRSNGHILGAANTVIAQDPSRLGKTLFTRKPGGDPVEIVRFRNADAEASGIVSEISRRQAEGLAWDDMAVLYRSNALSRSFEEAL